MPYNLKNINVNSVIPRIGSSIVAALLTTRSTFSANSPVSIHSDFPRIPSGLRQFLELFPANEIIFNSSYRAKFWGTPRTVLGLTNLNLFWLNSNWLIEIYLYLTENKITCFRLVSFKGVHLCKIFEKSIFFYIFCIFKIWLMMSLSNFHEFNLIKVWQGAKCYRKQISCWRLSSRAARLGIMSWKWVKTSFSTGFQLVNDFSWLCAQRELLQDQKGEVHGPGIADWMWVYNTKFCCVSKL